jgi:siroheme synthase
VISGHAPESYTPVLQSLPSGAATVVVLMGLAERRNIAVCLTNAGWACETPVAIVTNASQPDERVWIGTLGVLGGEKLAGAQGHHVAGFTEIEEFDARHDPGVIVVGDVVSRRTSPDIRESLSFEETSWQPTTIRRP